MYCPSILAAVPVIGRCRASSVLNRSVPLPVPFCALAAPRPKVPAASAVRKNCLGFCKNLLVCERIISDMFLAMVVLLNRRQDMVFRLYKTTFFGQGLQPSNL